MNIIIRDDQGLDTSLMMDGYSKEQRIEAMQAYEQLIMQSKSAETFNTAMNQIMGSCISEEELDGLYAELMESVANNSLYPQLKDKVTTLYSVLKKDENPDRRRLAQWALTYFFDDEDLIRKHSINHRL